MIEFLTLMVPGVLAAGLLYYFTRDKKTSDRVIWAVFALVLPVFALPVFVSTKKKGWPLSAGVFAASCVAWFLTVSVCIIANPILREQDTQDTSFTSGPVETIEYQIQMDQITFEGCPEGPSKPCRMVNYSFKTNLPEQTYIDLGITRQVEVSWDASPQTLVYEKDQPKPVEGGLISGSEILVDAAAIPMDWYSYGGLDSITSRSDQLDFKICINPARMNKDWDMQADQAIELPQPEELIQNLHQLRCEIIQVPIK